MSQALQAPVLLFVFNRVEQSGRVFDAVKAARPARLLVVADGPRSERTGEAETCERVRAIATAVDWPCTVHTNFLDDNVGCDERIVSGLDWAFSIVEEAIILEDDCIPDPTFFSFCDELLSLYREDRRVAMISGFNGVPDKLPGSFSYYFGLVGSCWGWATWRSRWSKFDAKLSNWPERRARGELNTVFSRAWDRRYYTARFDECYALGTKSPWDYRWFYTRIVEGGLAAVPRTNLVSNIGFGPGATHTVSDEPYPLPSRASLCFPLTKPETIVIDTRMDLLALDRLRHPLARHLWIKLKQMMRLLKMNNDVMR